MKANSRPDWTGRPPREMTPRALATLLGDWPTGGGPLYRRLADRLRTAIEQGDLPVGTRLPPERLLARALAVSRTTVVGAYGRLREQGLVESRQGSGTWVPQGTPENGNSIAHATAGPRETGLCGLIGGSPASLQLLGAHLPGVEGVFTAAVDAARPEIEEEVKLPGYYPVGVPLLRREVARFVTRSGLRSREDEILITTGAQQAINLAARAFLRPGDTVVLEDPTYVGAIDVFRLCGARLIPLPVGPEGVSPAALREAVVRNQARLVYLMPTYQNPTGATMPEARRREIARIVDELQVPLLEDNTLADIVLDTPPPPPIGAFVKIGPVLSVGSMSKLFWAGLRIGWVRASEAALGPLIHHKVVSDMGCSVPTQCVAAHVLEQADAVVRTRRQQVTAALEHTEALVAAHLPGCSFVRPKGGLVVWLKLPEGDANELAQIALRHGVSIVPGSLVSPQGGFADYVRLPLVPDRAFLKEAMERLGRAWSAYRKGARRMPKRSVGVIV